MASILRAWREIRWARSPLTINNWWYLPCRWSADCNTGCSACTSPICDLGCLIRGSHILFCIFDGNDIPKTIAETAPCNNCSCNRQDISDIRPVLGHVAGGFYTGDDIPGIGREGSSFTRSPTTPPMRDAPPVANPTVMPVATLAAIID